MSLSKIIGLAQVVNAQGIYVVHIFYFGHTESFTVSVDQAPYGVGKEDIYSASQVKVYDVPRMQEIDRYLTSLMNDKEVQLGP